VWSSPDYSILSVLRREGKLLSCVRLTGIRFAFVGKVKREGGTGQEHEVCLIQALREEAEASRKRHEQEDKFRG